MSKSTAGRRGGCGALRRPVNVREVRQRFLIVCGGQRTEVNYFEGFRMPTVRLRIHAIARSPVEVVEGTLRRLRAERRRGEEYDQVWCVFDRDEFPGDDFDSAIALARRQGIEVAYSNEAFELWYLLHFGYTDAELGRAETISRLERHLGHPYEKNSEAMYAELESRMDTAVGNAIRLLARWSVPDPANDNPSTTVHLLVTELRRYQR